MTNQKNKHKNTRYTGIFNFKKGYILAHVNENHNENKELDIHL